MKKLVIISSVLVTLALVGGANIDKLSAQSKMLYSQDKIEWMNPWLTTSNSAALGYNEVFLKDIKSYSEGSLSGYYQSGKLQNYYTPETTYGGVFDINSYIKLGKAYLKGGFSYDYSNSLNSKWRGWLDPTHTPFMLADSIPGNLSLEKYDMEAAIALPVSKSTLVGLDVKYQVGIMAKHKDLRNRNTIMNFEVYPSFVTKFGDFSVGLNLGFARNTEKVEYLQVDASTEKYLFYIYGLWLYSSNGFSSAETSREEKTFTYSGALTLDGSIGDLRIFNDFSAEYRSGLQTETGYNNLLHGQTTKLSYRDHLTLFYGAKHKLGLSAQLYTMTGDRFLQRQELDPRSNIRRWVTYGGPINYYYRTYREEEIYYTYRAAKSFVDVKWEISAGFKDMCISHKYKETPLVFSQNLTTRKGYIDYTQYIRMNNSLITISPNVGYSFSSGLKNDISQGQNQYQLESVLEQEYQFMQASKVDFGLEAKYIYKSLTASCGYNGVMATDSPIKGAARHSAILSVGFVF